MNDFLILIEEELRFFETEAQREKLRSFLIDPRAVQQSWQYGPERHDGIVVAANGNEQIVYCATGLGSLFPWSLQLLGSSDQGDDAQWDADLFEAFVRSTMWPAGPPDGFARTGPGERRVV